MSCIIKYPRPELHKLSSPVTAFDEKLQKLVTAMHAVLIAANGVGLAAPQIGKNIQVALVKTGEKDEDFKAYVNPRITYYSAKKTAIEEGCLSIPEVFAFVERSVKIRVQYYDLTGKKHTEKVKGMQAIIAQHEVDHLNGVLIIDRAIQITQGKEQLDGFRHGIKA